MFRVSVGQFDLKYKIIICSIRDLVKHNSFTPKDFIAINVVKVFFSLIYEFDVMVQNVKIHFRYPMCDIKQIDAW